LQSLRTYLPASRYLDSERGKSFTKIVDLVADKQPRPAERSSDARNQLGNATRATR
jgi:hypothetical protein